MTCSSKRKFIIYMVTFSICLGLLVPQVFSLSLEQIISRRRSTRSYNSGNISSQVLLEILMYSYGTTNGHRSVPKIGSSHSLIIYPLNATGCYRFIPETNSLIIHDLNINKDTIPASDFDGQSWVKDASIILIVVWDQTKMNNGYFASAEAGCLVQNIYLASISHDLGTCCVGDVDPAGLQNDLSLPGTLFPILAMPVGYPTTSYPSASPYDYTTGNLPPVQYSSLSFEDAVRNILFAQEWAARDLSLQELSQLLWAAYGYTSIPAGWHKAYHKTTPDSYAWYPLIIYVSNATGIYRYLPDSHPNATPMPDPNHAVTEILPGDKRYEIADACGGQVWAADAPATFLIVYNSSYNNGDTGDGGELPHLFTEVGAGCVVQELFLEASAWNLSANVVSEGLEEWDGTGAEELRGILGLPSSAIPLYIVPVGARALGHDVAVLSVVPSSNEVNEGDLVNVTVVVRNNGIFTETFDVTAYANTIVIQTQTVFDLASGSQTTLTFIWDTTGVSLGDYTIKAEASIVPGETYAADNVKVNGIVNVIPEFPSLLVLPLFMIASLLAAMVYRRRQFTGPKKRINL